MALSSVNIHPLSALNPVKFTYKYNSEEKLAGTANMYQGGFAYNEYELFRNYKDAVMSKQNCLVLSDVKPLSAVFVESPRDLSVGTIAGSMFLKTQQGQYVTTTENQLFVGGSGERLFLRVLPSGNDTVELKATDTHYLQIDTSYPYTVRLSEEILGEGDTYRREFKIDYAQGKVSFKNQTAEGFRYLSFSGIDKVVRAVGVELNDTVVNPYRWTAELVSSDSLLYDFNPRQDEVKYYNDLVLAKDRKTLNIKQVKQRDTNYIVTCPTSNIPLSGDVVVNIASAKTNFSSSNTYFPLI